MSSVSEMIPLAIGQREMGTAQWKSVMDLVLALVLFFLTWPVMAIAMLLVRVTSPGPMIYRQRRLGQSGRRFTIYKIRTMYHDCERLTGPALVHAGRQTRHMDREDPPRDPHR